MISADTIESWEEDLYDDSDCEPMFRPLPGDLIVTKRLKGTYFVGDNVFGSALIDNNTPCLVISFDQHSQRIIILTPIGLREANTLGWRAA